MAEASHVPHHPQKIALIFSAMRHFTEALRQRGVRVQYVTLDDPRNTGSVAGEELAPSMNHAPNLGHALGTLLNDLGFKGLGVGTACWLHEIPLKRLELVST